MSDAAMSRIEQFYWTSCNPRTRFMDAGYGYHLRAASCGREGVDGTFVDTLQDLLFKNRYEPPADIDRNTWPKLQARNMPVRLIYRPNIAGMSLLVRDCFRTYDASETQRLGSQFAHGLRTRVGNAWPTIECLRLWEAPWWISQDPAEPRPTLANFPSWTDLPPFAVQPLIDERVMESFVQTPANGEFYDPGNIIPEWLRRIVPRRRQEILIQLLRGFLELDLKKGQWLLLVADPELAALLFFSLLRLLPTNYLSEPIGFSTYERHLMDSPAPLVATTFREPLSQTLVTTWSKTRPTRCGFILDVFRNRALPFQNQRDQYPRLVVSTLASQGWEAVEQLLTRFAEVRLTTPDKLEEYAGEEQRVRKLFQEGTTPPPSPAPNTSAAAYASRAIEDRFLRPVTTPDGATTYGDPAAIAAAAGIIPLTQLLMTGERVLDKCRAFAPVVRSLRDNSLVALSLDARLPDDFRLGLLQEHVRRRRNFPAAVLRQARAAEERAADRTAQNAESLPHDASLPSLLGRVISQCNQEVLQQMHADAGAAYRGLILRWIAAQGSSFTPGSDFLWSLVRSDPNLTIDFLMFEQLFEPMADILQQKIGDRVPTGQELQGLSQGGNAGTVAQLLLRHSNPQCVEVASRVLRHHPESEVFPLLEVAALSPESRISLLTHYLSAREQLDAAQLRSFVQRIRVALQSPEDERKRQQVIYGVLSRLGRNGLLKLVNISEQGVGYKARLEWLEIFHRFLVASSQSAQGETDVAQSAREIVKSFENSGRQSELLDKYGAAVVPYASPTLIDQWIEAEHHGLTQGPFETTWPNHLRRLTAIVTSPIRPEDRLKQARAWLQFLEHLTRASEFTQNKKPIKPNLMQEITRSFVTATEDLDQYLYRRDLLLRYLRTIKSTRDDLEGGIAALARRHRVAEYIGNIRAMVDPDSPPKRSIDHRRLFRFEFPRYFSPAITMNVRIKALQEGNLVGEKTVTIPPGSYAEVNIEHMKVQLGKFSSYNFAVSCAFTSAFWEDAVYSTRETYLRANEFESGKAYDKITFNYDVLDQNYHRFLDGLLHTASESVLDDSITGFDS
jgi:hypothetical protein